MPSLRFLSPLVTHEVGILFVRFVECAVQLELNGLLNAVTGINHINLLLTR